MTNPSCTRIRPSGDCLTRGARNLCQPCASLLSEDEHREREAHFWLKGIKHHVKIYMEDLKRRCLTPGTWRKYAIQVKQGKCIQVKFTRHLPDGVHPEPVHATCMDMLQKKICPGCVAGKSDRQLIAYRLRVTQHVAKQEDLRASLEASGWPFADPDTYYSSAVQALGLFIVSMPCFVHGREGLL